VWPGQWPRDLGGSTETRPTIRSMRETPAHRRALLRLPIVFRDPESIQFAGRTDERDLRIHENAAAHDQTSPAGAGRGLLGRRFAGKTDDPPAGLQGNAQGNAAADGPATRLHSARAHRVARLQKHLAAE